MTAVAVSPAAVRANDRSCSSAWTEAVELSRFRDDLASLGLEHSVRAIARRRNTSAGRVGDLLKIASAFPPDAVETIGALENADRFSDASIEDIGNECLSRLSFRALRRLSSLPFRQRVFGVRAAQSSSGSMALAPARTGTDASVQAPASPSPCLEWSTAETP